MKTLTPSERRALRALAHALDPVVIIGHHGLTAAVLKEIDSSLRAHELIKVRCADGDRAVREAALARICAELDAAPVQHLGKLLIVWRPRPVDAVAADTANSNKPSTTTSTRRRAPAAPRAGTAKAPAAGGRGKPAAAKRSPSANSAGAKAKRTGVRAVVKGEAGARSRASTTGATPASRRANAGKALPTGATRRLPATAAPVARTAPRRTAKSPAAQNDTRRTASGALPPSGAASRRRRRTT